MDFGNTQTSPVRKGKSYGDTLKKGASGEPVFGRPSKPREQEPSFSQLMQWQPQSVNKSDFKKNRKDLIDFEDPQFEFYRTKIQKADHQWVSEARDNYRDFKNPEKGMNVRHYNPYSGEYSAPLPPEMQQQDNSMRARKGGYPNEAGAGVEYAVSLPIGSEYQMGGQQRVGQYQQQSSQYQQQGGYQLQLQQLMNGQKVQQPSMVSPIQSMVSPSQVQYAGEVPAMQQSYSVGQEAWRASNRNIALASEDEQREKDLAATQGHNAPLAEEDQDEFINYDQEEIDPEQAKLDHQHMKDFLRTSRWKPNSYTQKVLARPAFMNYGYKNVNPTVGGFLYGQYLHSHNVNPQRGMQPEYRQVYKNAQMFGDRVPPHTAPEIPRPKPPTINEEKVKEEEMKRNPLEAEKLNSGETKKQKKTNGGKTSMTRPASAGKSMTGSGNTNLRSMQGSVSKQPQQQQQQQPSSYMLHQPQYQPQPQANIQVQQQQALGQSAPKITITPADLDNNRAAQMSAAEKERLMAKIGKDSGYPGNNNYLSPNDMNKTVKIGGGNNGVAGRVGGVPQVGFIDQLSETKKVEHRKDSGYESNYGGASSIRRYANYDDFLEIGSGF